MPSETPNLRLNHWTPDDYFRLTEINENFTKIDAAVGANTTAVAAKAATTALAEVRTLAEGRAQCATGSYVGTGTSGPSNPTTITFPFTPKLVLVMRGTTTSMNGADMSFNLFLWDHTNSISYSSGVVTAVSYSGNTMIVTHDRTGYSEYQMNIINRTYTWIAIG